MSLSQTPENFEIVAESASVQETDTRKRSVVWKHFERVAPRSVQCKYCADPFTHDKGMGTTHLPRHLEKACKKITQEQRELYNASKNDSLLQSADFVFDPELTRDLMTLLYIDAEIPFAIIDSRFWDPAMKSLNPEYNSVGRQTLRNDCVEVFKNGMEVSLREFEELDSRVCFTSDIWTSSVNLGYLCLTAHYIDKDFNFRKKIIAFKQISYPHTGLAIANMIEKILIDWKLDKKIFTLTLDNCKANDSAIKFLEKKLWNNSTIGLEHMHMRCAAHILNLMIQEGVEVIHPVLHLLRALMRHVTSSGPRLQNFNSISKDLNLGFKRGLTLDCPTRWNSTYDMVTEALVYKDALSRFGDESSYPVPSFEEWKDAKEVEKFLEVFLDCTKSFSNFTRPSSHTYVKEVWAVRGLLLEEDINLSLTLRNVAKEMQKKFDKYWKNPNLILILACVFDPRYKLAFVKFCYRVAYGDDSNEKWKLFNLHSKVSMRSMRMWFTM